MIGENVTLLSHVTSLTFHAWKCNRRCKHILNCGKQHCKKTCCTELRHECLALWHPQMHSALSDAVSLFADLDATRVSWNQCTTYHQSTDDHCNMAFYTLCS
ncbi:hypothetical protein T11_11466 [Trichinella zimbabwensis]|uniref:Uncharacterized protein n=1 Tax=Trichinella zimbabwensis TaxID=268475 RepID=A0A0V1H6D9_9BILA|nr:hypothetical protein T11_11466 [Trichinella zimbabwensis]